MKEFLVFVERHAYNSLVVKANSEQEAREKVQERIDKFGLDLQDWDVDDDQISGIEEVEENEN